MNWKLIIRLIKAVVFVLLLQKKSGGDDVRDVAGYVRGRLRARDGLPAKIYRGQEFCEATIVLAATNYLGVAKNDFRVESDAQDILIASAEYQPTGVVSNPENGDRIEVTMLDESVATFDVRPPDKGRQCFQGTAHGTELRVHCRRVTAVASEV